MTLKDKLSENHLLLFVKMLPDMIAEYWRFSKQTVRCGMSKNPEKLLTEILMLTHALEKGFSIHDKKKGFGEKKLLQLVSLLVRYFKKYGYSEALETPIALSLKLIDFHRRSGFLNESFKTAEKRVCELISQVGKEKDDFSQAGYIHKSCEEMQRLSNANFEVLAQNRYSFRHFSDEPVLEGEIKKVLDIAKKSPSACNRQAYRVHVFSKDMKNQILLLQGGANSFYKEVDKALLITGNLNRYYSMEQHLSYVDASLFAMSLMYAMTANGIASIPLTMGRKRKELVKIRKMMNLPENEEPVLLIAIGHYPKQAELSLSARNPIEYFTKFH